MERILVPGWWDKGLFNSPHRRPSHQVCLSSCFVVGATSSSSSKGLLAYHCTCWLVVDVEVACRLPQYIES